MAAMRFLPPAVPYIAALLLAAPAAAQIDPAQLSADDKILASPAFEGRAPGTPGEEKTVAWLTERLRGIGLQPGGPGGAWVQPVPLVRTLVTDATISASVGGKAMPLVQGSDVYVSTVKPEDRVAIAGAPMVFVGYGVTAPEQGWDDFKSVDLHGKIAVFLVNDPDFGAAAGDDAYGKFGGRRMTYYGRWTYKYEEAARRGAIGALIVHDTLGAGYGWSTVIAPRGENYDIADAPPPVAMQGWLSGEAATRLFAASGQDLVKMRAAARRRDFRPVALGTTLDATLAVAHSSLQSRNVLAKLPGTTHADEVVMYGAHWDAYGKAPDGTIRPGANDDGLGVAGLIGIAEAFAKAPRPDRSVVFAFWTGEERGLLGSETYAAHPVYPVAKTVANITLDILQTGGPSRDVMLTGAGQSDMEALLKTAAAAKGRVVTPEALPERGLFYRADHFSLAKRGVPSLLFMAISGAPDLVDGGRAGGEKWLARYMACYHPACDAYGGDGKGGDFDLAGAAADVDLA